MQLTGKQIVDWGMVTNFTEAGVQQQGVDVRLDRVFMLDDHDDQFLATTGYVPKEGKTLPAKKVAEIHPEDVQVKFGVDPIFRKNVFALKPGYYEIYFEEGCTMPANVAMYFKTRSSLVRCGAIVQPGQFDAGFETDKMGAFLHVIKPIMIEKGARVAQMIVNESYVVDDEDMYHGQWQGK